MPEHELYGYDDNDNNNNENDDDDGDDDVVDDENDDYVIPKVCLSTFGYISLSLCFSFLAHMASFNYALAV